MNRQTEICIVGGGLVGLTAAIAFSQQGRCVTLLEERNLQLDQPAELDARSIALSYSSAQILQSLDLWRDLQPQTAAIERIHVSSAGHFGVTRLDAAEHGLSAMGYVVEYHILLQALLVRAKSDPNIVIVSPLDDLSVTQAEDSVTFDFRVAGKKESLRAALLLVADGAHSTVREKLGIEAETLDYQQSAIIANVKLERAANGCAYERFTAAGPLALLPLPNRRYALVWTHTPARAEQMMQLADEDFLQQLYEIFGYRLGYFSKLGQRARFDLALTRAKRLVAGRAVLIGNAANTLHPVAGQGFNLALRDVGLLYDEISGLDLGAEKLPSALGRYEQGRAEDQRQTVAMGNGLVELFSNDMPLLNHLRAAALAALDLCPVLKSEFGWRGMGYGSGCSSLMRGRGNR